MLNSWTLHNVSSRLLYDDGDDDDNNDDDDDDARFEYAQNLSSGFELWSFMQVNFW